jgi:hypothetical protein
MDVNVCQQYKLFFSIGIYFFNFISNNNCRLLTTVQVFDIMFDTSAPPSCWRSKWWTNELRLFFKYFYAGIRPSPFVNLHNSMPAMNYFDSNRTNTVIFNHSWTVYTRHLVAQLYACHELFLKWRTVRAVLSAI